MKKHTLTYLFLLENVFLWSQQNLVVISASSDVTRVRGVVNQSAEGGAGSVRPHNFLRGNHTRGRNFVYCPRLMTLPRFADSWSNELRSNTTPLNISYGIVFEKYHDCVRHRAGLFSPASSLLLKPKTKITEFYHGETYPAIKRISKGVFCIRLYILSVHRTHINFGCLTRSAAFDLSHCCHLQ